jgi:NlpC/P60 family
MAAFLHWGDFKMLTQDIKKVIAQYAHTETDEEVCGVVLKSGEVVPSQNLAEDPTTGFILDNHCSELIFRGEGIAAVYHSHCLDEQPRIMAYSGMDEEGNWQYGDIFHSQRSNLPYILYHSIEESWDYYDPNELHPFPLLNTLEPTDINFYLRWQWMVGRSDCYSLMRSYYRAIVGIELPEFDRTANPDGYKEPGWDKFRSGLVENDFVALDPSVKLQIHDVPLMRFKGENWHHVGIICDVEKSHMVHHLGGLRLSDRVIYGGDWLNATHKIYRHRTLMD